MFGLGKQKPPYLTVTCRAKKLEGQAVLALQLNEVDLVEVIKAADASALCTRISFGKIYQKPGTMLAENDSTDQGYNARYDKITKSLGVNLRQGFMRQTLVFSTREPQQLCADMGLTLEMDPPPEPTVS
ncbi:hypothetical protein [Chitinimonas sp. BJYL2]|uniref:hypothetical protein n=1 Tax=Chitinimonas sp. BJYL2 TaxID=2976696 RepID=UPI0022B5DC45|nr:hypothetical protein [Chitinimonas sp. BJYL2]